MMRKIANDEDEEVTAEGTAASGRARWSREMIHRGQSVSSAGAVAVRHDVRPSVRPSSLNSTEAVSL